MSSPLYFDFLSSVWDQFSDEDREVFAELWQGYEQVISAVYQKYMELSLNVSINDLRAWTTERWLPYTFNSSNFINRPATLLSNQDLSAGVNTTVRNLLCLSVNGGTPFEVNIRGKIPVVTTIDEIIFKINLAAGFKFAGSVFNNSILLLTSNVLGANSLVTVHQTSIPSANACEFLLGVDVDVLPDSYPKYKYPYTIKYTNVRTLPWLRDSIRDETMTVELVEGTDYMVEEGGLVFKEIPPASMWAERTNIDEENPWANFGYLTEIYQKNSPRYVGALKGLWFSLWNGPKPSNIRIALYLLFGLPTAPEEGTITVANSTTITMRGLSGATYTFPVPTGLNPDVSVGSSVTQFQPLVDGINVYDKINYPGFVEKEIGREGIGRFLTENATRGEGDTDETKALRLLEEHTFLPQISVDTFVFPDINMTNVKTFLSAFRPLSKAYMFQVILGAFRELLGLNDRVDANIDFILDSSLDVNETTHQDAATLTTYEDNPSSGLNLDPAGMLFDENVEIEVREGATLKDRFTA